MYLLLSIFLIIFSIIPLLGLLRLKTLVQTILISYLLGYSLITITAEIAGIIGLLDRQIAFILIQVFEMLVFWVIWLARRKPTLLFWTKFNIDFPKLRDWKKNWYLLGFGIIVFLGYGVLAWLILNVPPNNSDSMHTHLARVIYWLQQGSFKQLTCYSIFAKIYPFDAQLNILWTVLLTGSDKFVGFIQYFAAVFTAIAITGISRLLGSTKKASVFIGLLWLTLPLVVFQATTTQFDLVVSALFCIFAYFFLGFIKNKSDNDLLFSSLAMGLCLGTKETVFLFGPGLGLLLLILWVKDHYSYKWIVRLTLLTFGFFLLLGSYTYINNIKYYKNPLGPSEHVILDSVGKSTIKEKFQYNPLRFLYQFISFDSLPLNVANALGGVKGNLFNKLDDALKIDLESDYANKQADEIFSFTITPNYNEDQSWFGIVGFLLVSGGVIAGFYQSLVKKSFLALSLLMLGLSFLIFEIVMRPGWDPYQGRYFLLPISVTLPLSVYLISPRWTSRVFQCMLVLVCLVTFFYAVFTNELKPILARQDVSNEIERMETDFSPKNWAERNFQIRTLKFLDSLFDSLPFDRSIDSYTIEELATLGNQSHHLQIIKEVNKVVPSNARMGIMLVNGDFDYIFFGRDLQRTLININRSGQLLDQSWLDGQHLDFVLIDDVAYLGELPSSLIPVVYVDGWGLFEMKK